MSTSQKWCKPQMKTLSDLSPAKISWRIVQNAIRSQVIAELIFVGNNIICQTYLPAAEQFSSYGVPVARLILVDYHIIMLSSKQQLAEKDLKKNNWK
jgi:hypothetical protein